MLKQLIVLLSVATAFASQEIFNVQDDILAFPQYELVFSQDSITGLEAESQIERAVSLSLAKFQTSSTNAASSRPVTSDLTQPFEGSKAQLSGSSEDSEASESHQRMILGSKHYLCTIPYITESKATNSTIDEAVKIDEEKELARATSRGWELLKDMEGHCMYFVSGWWSYSFCYNDKVKQFHSLPPGRGGVPSDPPIEDDQVPAFILGQFYEVGAKAKQVERGDNSIPNKKPVPGRSTFIRTKGEMRYMVQNLSDGTICDLTGKPRKVEIQFHCHPQSSDRIGWIKEIATCAYLMVIYTPRLCSDIAFLPPKQIQAHRIVCRQVVGGSNIETTPAEEIIDNDSQDIIVSTEEPDRASIGGIIVGGMRQVGKEGRRITLPKAPENAVEKSGEVIAKWNSEEFGGKVQKLSDSDLRNMELDPGMVKDMIDKLREESNGKSWKLEVIEIGRGNRELHGIIDQDENGVDTAEGAPGDQRENDSEAHNSENEDGESYEHFKNEL